MGSRIDVNSKLSQNAMKVLEKRYLKKDSSGNETNYVYEVPLTLNGSEAGNTYYTHIQDSDLTLDDGATQGTFTIDPIEVNAKEIRHVYCITFYLVKKLFCLSKLPA